MALLLAFLLSLLPAPARAAARAPDLFQTEQKSWQALPAKNASAKGAPLLGKGKVRVVFFWASWCAYCKKALRELTPELTSWREQGGEFYAISVEDSEKDLEEHLEKNPMRIPVWWGGPAAKSAFKIGTIPTILLLNDKNRIMSAYAGYGSERFGYLRKRLRGLLKRDDEEN